MKKLLLLSAAALALCFSKKTDTYPFDKWDAATTEKANTAKDASYLSSEEKQVIYYCNLARLKPDVFAKTYLAKFVDSTKMKSTSFMASLKNDLEGGKTKPMEVLTPKQDLFDEASDHAGDLGKTGKRGEFNADGKSFSFRMAKFKGVYGGVVENCDYGNNKALAVAISMLIDEGNASITSRRNILNKDIKYAGISIKEHKKDKWCAVMDFGK
jgi:uncharacterized protein YkwD